jgi:hypothetical protein
MHGLPVRCDRCRSGWGISVEKMKGFGIFPFCGKMFAGGDMTSIRRSYFGIEIILI